MTTWQDVEAAQPDLARRVQTRFEDTGLALAATVRADGSPRISGWEPLFAMGELWLGGMTESRKSTDVRRDPRLALHNATADKDAKAGDAKISGRAVEVTDEERRSAFMRHFKETNGMDVPGPFDLFVVDVTELSMLNPAGDHLDIEWWRPGEAIHKLERY